MKKNLFCFTIICLISACGNLGHKFDGLQQPLSDEALIYYYRPNRLLGKAIFYDIKENGQTITTLYDGGYYPHRTTAGNKLITAKTEASEELSFPVENGQTYFVRGKVHMGIIAGRPSLKLVPKEKALKEIEDCKLIEENK